VLSVADWAIGAPLCRIIRARFLSRLLLADYPLDVMGRGSNLIAAVAQVPVDMLPADTRRHPLADASESICVARIAVSGMSRRYY